MSLHAALRQVLVVLGATGSLVPGMTASLAPSPAPDRLRHSWDWPLDPRPSVTAHYVSPRSDYGAGHRGLDLAARPGQHVSAVDAGIVTHVGVVAGRGTVSVTHASGLRSTYEPVRGEVAVGAVVAQGEVLGSVEGRTHCGGACLHLGALRAGGYVDPRPLLGGGPVVLLPLPRAG